MLPKRIKKLAKGYLSDSIVQATTIILVIMVIYITFVLGEMSLYYVLNFRGLIGQSDYSLFGGNSYVLIITGIRILLEYLLIVPAYVGAKWWYLHAVRGEKNSVKSMFVCYRSFNIYFKTLALKTMVVFTEIIAAIPVIVCGYVLYRLLGFGIDRFDNQIYAVLLAFLTGVALICLLLLYFIFIINFSLADYLYVLNPDLNIFDIIKVSVSVMRKERRKIINLIISFLGWLPLCLLIFPLLFILPYFAMSMTVCIEKIIEDNKILDRKLCLLPPEPRRKTAKRKKAAE